MNKPAVYPADWMFRPELQLKLDEFGRRFLAEGDSWFTIGALNLPQVSNLLYQQQFGPSTVIISCAYPGDTLQQMGHNINDPYFDKLLRKKNFASYWEAIILSAGGNDLIDAAQHRAVNADGRPAPVGARVVLTPEGGAPVPPRGTRPERYLSDAGWDLLASYLRINLEDLVTRRDQGPSAGRPLFLHTYSPPVVRPSGTVGAAKGWLYPAMVDYGIPEADWQGVAALLFDGLRRLWLKAGQELPHVHVFDSATLVPVGPAQPGPTRGSGGRGDEIHPPPRGHPPGGRVAPPKRGPPRVSGDWDNEIHLTPGGYRKVGAVMGPWIDSVLATYP